MNPASLAVRTRRALGGLLGLVLAGPPLALGACFTGLADMANGLARLVAGDPPPRAPMPAGSFREAARAPSIPDLEIDILGYRRAARALFVAGFDTAEIAVLLMEPEADVARWVPRAPQVFDRRERGAAE